jgi:hypothetical protein
VKLLKRQTADVDKLLGAMARQLADLAAAYREELENVERALLQVRCLAHMACVDLRTKCFTLTYLTDKSAPA